MQYVQDNAEEAVRQVVASLEEGKFSCKFDSGEEVKVNISIDQQKRNATIDFTGTSSQVKKNLNATALVGGST
ncbi:hydantoinase B/oxoprolinase family protein [Selenihalanaerobacter shriftii]|uniref:Hydantoinase B/oxoprolinase n=1 Tax=Selenihalanaerobacter shriftii TaxID=142842 RepID=A0A1T4R1V9_9FIRM|nr:hydantoinase B/oxoprolinase family protein [Selenihalanaerobacter shriftii]SKA09990.1 Hydantoinase B/oxoprolinase [Selenihalanaerobacter shriftii]